jgi:fructoselysine-6-P-deglycase FrlB-like protein
MRSDTRQPRSAVLAISQSGRSPDIVRVVEVAATKTYLASLHAVAQIAALLGDAEGRGAWFGRLPKLVSATVEAQLADRDRFDRLAGSAWLTAVGRGLHLATAFETALKVRELSGLVALADIGVLLPAGPPSWVAAIVAVIPGQVAALRLGELAGVELDRPHGLRKVTLTR